LNEILWRKISGFLKHTDVSDEELHPDSF